MNEAMSFSYWITSTTGLVHALAALACLLIGPVLFLRRKGDLPHRLLGGTWILLMLAVDISALLTYELGGKPNLFHFFALVSLCAVLPGLYCILKYSRTKKPGDLRNHMEFMGWAYFGLAAAGTWQIVISLARVGVITLPYPILFNSLGALTALTSIGLYFAMRQSRLPDRYAE